MNAYVSAKFEGDDNREIVEGLCTAAQRAGFVVTCTNRDYDDFGTAEAPDEQLTDFMFAGIEDADVVLLDLTDKGVGLGIEAGYATALRKPVVALYADGAEPSTTLNELATRTITYHGFADLTDQLTSLKATLS